jgi:tetratricopeptide (TPR) repeat protein
MILTSIPAAVKPLAAYHDQYRLALLDSGLYFADGQIQDEVFVLGSFLQSKMAQKGVTCANCHDAHTGKTIAEGNALCAQCHKPAAFDNRNHHRHPPDSAGAECVNCHMPERLYMGVDWRRDHGFSIPNPERSSNIGTPNACTNCHQDKENAWAARAMTEWGISRKDDPWALFNHKLELGDSLTFRDYARQREPAVQAPIQQATLISKLAGFPSRLAIETASGHLASPDPLIRRAAIGALQAIPLQLRWQLLQSLMTDPVKSVRLDVASALADVLPQLEGSDAEQLGRLIDEYRESINYNADTPGGQLAIGNLELRLGYSILAEQAYQKALDIEPQFVPALINLADLYRAIGSDGEASALLQRAVEIAPDSANSNHAYGLYLVRSGKQDEALKYLETATRQQDASPRHVYVYAVALDSRGETEAAMKVIELASRRWVNNIDLYFLQVSYMDKTGNTDDIHRYLSTLVSVAFSNPQVKAWANKYGSGKS